MMTTRPLAIRPETVNLVMPLIVGGRDVDEVTEVTSRSRRSHRVAVRKLAEFFRREFGYDFVQYHEDDLDCNPRDTAYLWIHPEACDYVAWTAVGDRRTVFRVPCIGACCFRWREWQNAPHGFALAWIWLHPYWRRHGLLSRQWSAFRAKFGVFDVEGPLSEAMKRFVEKVNEVK